MFNGYLSENIMFSETHEVDRKVKPKVSAGLSGNVMECVVYEVIGGATE